MADKTEYHTLVAEAEALLSSSTNAAIRDRISLRDAICAYLAVERAGGSSIEMVLKTVEEILKRAEDTVAAAGGMDGHQQLAQKLIDWCIELDRTRSLRIVS